MTGQLNQEVRFCLYTGSVTENGTPSKTDAGCYVDWVKIEQLSSSRALEQAQIQFSTAYKITKRHYPARPVNVQLTEIEYGDKILSIHSIKFIGEGRKTYEELTCYAVNNTN